MQPIQKAFTIASLVGAATYGVVFTRALRHLLAHQPPHASGLPMTPDATGFPSSSAWILAAPSALSAFVVVFVVSALMLTHRRRKFDWRFWLTIRRVRSEVESLVRLHCPDAKVFHFGAVRIDPRLLAIWIRTKTDKERDQLRENRELLQKLPDALLRAGYPPDAVPHVGFAFESQETVDREFGGSWYRATK